MRLNAFAGRAGSPTPTVPILSYVSLNLFQVTNPVPGATYTMTLLSGSGTATYSSITNQITLTGTTARFSVTVGWSALAAQSPPAYMDHQPRVNNVYNPCSYCATPETFDNCGPPLKPDGSYYCSCGTLGGCGNPNDCCGWVCHSYYVDCSYYSLNYGPQASGYTLGADEWWKTT